MSQHHHRKRSTTTRDRHRAIIRRSSPPCALCGQPIDYSLPYLDPLEYVVDHIVPLALGGTDTLENKQAAHRTCNRTKGSSLTFEPPKPQPLTTSRDW